MLRVTSDTVMVAVAFFVSSEARAAVTWYVPVRSGAVYRPMSVTLPPAAPSSTLHRSTPAPGSLPFTVAVNVLPARGASVTLSGLMLMGGSSTVILTVSWCLAPLLFTAAM